MKKIGLAILLCSVGLLFMVYVASSFVPLMTARGSFCELSELPWPEEGRIVKEEHHTAGTAFSRMFIVECQFIKSKDWTKEVEASNGIMWRRSKVDLFPPLMPFNWSDDEFLWCTYRLDNRYHVMVVVDEQAGRLYLEWWGQ